MESSKSWASWWQGQYNDVYSNIFIWWHWRPWASWWQNEDDVCCNLWRPWASRCSLATGWPGSGGWTKSYQVDVYQDLCQAYKLVLIVETVFRFCSEVWSRHLLVFLTSSAAWLTIWREASGLCCWEESGSTRCRQPRTKRKTEEHFSVLDFSNKCFEKVFDLGAVVIEDDIETRHWLLAPL